MSKDGLSGSRRSKTFRGFNGLDCYGECSHQTKKMNILTRVALGGKEKKDFQSWRTGPAFKEAHGGGDIFSFVGMIISGFLTSNGPPTPCFWRGQVKLPDVPPPVKFDGGPGSKPEFDGSKDESIEPDVFVSIRRFSTPDHIDMEKQSELLIGASGLRFSQSLTRDDATDDGAGGALMSVWDSKEDYEASALGQAMVPSRGEALYEGILVLEK